MLELLTEEPLKYNLDEIVRLGAKKMLLHALEAEVAQVIEQSKSEIGPDGKRLLTRNGVGRIRTVALVHHFLQCLSHFEVKWFSTQVESALLKVKMKLEFMITLPHGQV